MNDHGGRDFEQIEVVAENQRTWEPIIGEETRQLMEHSGLPREVQAQICDEALAILARCVSPRVAPEQRTGLVVGYVQSGKTMSFTTVAALARDNGFAIVIVIAGTSTILTQQSRERLANDLRLNSRDDKAWRRIDDPRIETQSDSRIQQAVDDWLDSSIPSAWKQTVLITVMKHHQHLRHLTNVCRRLRLENVPVLVIDDEADQAGLNNLINQNEESTTYARLCDLRAAIPHHTFLQYTATPQGPLLINIIDVLSPTFAATVTPGPGYTGGKEFFLHRKDLVRTIPPGDIPSRDNQLDGPPESLLEAMRVFYLGVASGMIRDHFRGNRTMMVHPSQRTILHNDYQQWIRSIQADWARLLDSPSDPDYPFIVQEFRDAYEDLATTVEDLEPFQHLLNNLPRAIRRTDIWEVNTRTDNTTPQVEWKGNYSHIVVGGQALDRGFTLSGLTVTYMPRGVGARRLDTIQQRARFFGYKGDYLDYCRVYLDHEIESMLENYVQHEEDVREQLELNLAEGRSLDQMRRAFLLPQGFAATRDSIIDIAYLRARLRGGWFHIRAPHDSPRNGGRNQEIVSGFLESLPLAPDLGSSERTDFHRHNVCESLPLASVYERLLLELRFSRLTDAQNFLAILVLLRNVLRDEADASCTVYQMSQGRRRERRLSPDGEIRQLFQGAHPSTPRSRQGSIYPGDRDIHNRSFITLQIHTLDLKGMDTDSVEYSCVPSLAIWLPQRYANDVLIQDQGGEDDDQV